MKFVCQIVVWFGACFLLYASAQPRYGHLFREYAWAKPEGDAGGSLRVGGKLDYGGTPIAFPHKVDLEHATAAEVVAEKLLCHDGTRGLAIAFNGHAPITFPEAPNIPAPQWDYQHFTFPVVPVPLSHLKAGGENTFTLRVSDEHSWDWPQNLIYGLQLRVYYDPARKPHPSGRITSPKPGSPIGRSVELRAETSAGSQAVRVDFVGLYEGVNWEGDGNYRQWHYTYFKGALTNHLGSATAPPWRATWDTSWLPNQREPMQLAARITDASGLTWFTPPVGGLKLDRPGFSVELCRPFDVPKKWVTRSGEKTQKFRVAGDLKQAVAAQFLWSSWSPGYMNGLFLNDTKVFDREGPRYACFWHRVPLADLSALRPGENTLKTGLTPKYDGKTVHGMEVNWPGIMVLIQYRTQP